jgi:hypothetical protein
VIQEFQHSLESKLIEVMIYKMLPIQFVSNINLIQMWLMKVTYKMKNTPIQELQHSLESKLIESMNMKMLSIQFVPNVNSTQIWLMEVMNMKVRGVQLVSTANLIQL